MDAIVRYIFRIDFKPCFDLADRLGSALAIISDEEGEKYWTQVGVSRERIGVTATKEVPGVGQAQSFSFEINNMNSTYRSEGGIDVEEFLDHDSLALCETLHSRLSERFGLGKYNRVGFRVFVLGGEAEEFGQTRETFKRNAFNSELFRSQKYLGQIKDFATVFEGTLDSGTQYRVSTGPSGEKDRERMLDAQVKGQFEPHAYTVDLDIFERDIDFKHTSLYRWVKLRWPSVKQFVSMSRDLAVE